MRGRNRHNRGNRPEQYENESRNRYGSQYDNQYSDQYGEREQRWGSPGRGVEQDRYQQRQGWDEERSWRGRNDQPAEENLGWPAQRYQDRYGSDTENYGGADLDYAPVKKRSFIVSGTRGTMHFYERVSFTCGGRLINSWALLYPVAERHIYDRIVEAIARTYSPGAGRNGRCD